MYFFAIAILMFFAFIAQHFMGDAPWVGGRILLLPVLFFYGAAALPLWSTLVLAVMAGFMWDAVTVQVVDGRMEIAFGWSMLLYGALGAVMNGLRPLFQRGHFLIHCLMTGGLTSLAVLIEYLIITFRREPLLLVFNKEVWLRILGSGVTAALIAVPVFLALNWLGKRTGLLKLDGHAA